MSKKLPKRKETTTTGITAEEYLLSRFGRFCNVIQTPASKDLGIDMRAELFEDNYPTGIHFNIQCKGTKELENEGLKKEGSVIKVPVKVATINYWLQQREPTFLVVVDVNEDEFYWCYPFDQVKRIIEEIQKQEKITIKVDTERKYDSKINSIPSKMIEHINDYHYDVLEKIVFILNKLYNNVSDLNVKAFTNFEKMNSAIYRIMKSVSLVKDLNDKVQMQIKIIINKEINNYYEAIIQLDYIVETKMYLKSDSTIYNESFGGRVPRALIKSLQEKANKYFEESSSKNLNNLKNEINELFELNKDLHGFLKEMKMEEGWGPY